MRKRTLSFFLLLCYAQGEEVPKYSRANFLNQVALTPIPNARFINVGAFKKYKKCIKKNRKKNLGSKGCVDYEFTAPFGTKKESLRVATDLREAWQRLEDRYYHRAMLELNNPGMYFTHCVIDWSDGQKANPAIHALNTEKFMYPKALHGKIPEVLVNDDLKLDNYITILPKVKKSDYCKDISPKIEIMYLPGSCVYTAGVKTFCIEGTQETMNNAPNPINFRYDLALERIQAATKKTHTDYVAEYQKDVLEALKPNAKFNPLIWTGLDNAVVAPIAQLKPDLSILNQNAKEAGSSLGGVFQTTARPYYAQALTGPPAELLEPHHLPRHKDILEASYPPGVWKLEEFKRRFPLNNPVMYQRFGYVNLFQSWNDIKPRLLPEDVGGKAIRQMIYRATGFKLDLATGESLPMPALVLIKEYTAGLPYSGPSTRFTWVSVAEGYEVPRVNGRPKIDYKAVTK